MRPHTAVPPTMSRKIQKNDLNGHYYIITSEGKQIKANRNGQLDPKFVKFFTGFANFKQRKNQSSKDKSLMYTQPNINYNKNQAFICPKGSKFNGYAQFPYNFKKCFPEHLDKETYKQSTLQKFDSKVAKTNLRTNSSSSFSQTQKDQAKIVNKFKSLKNIRAETFKKVNFDLLQASQNTSFHEFQSKIKSKKVQNKFQRSIILQKRDEYQSQMCKNLNKLNYSKSSSTFHSSGDKNETGKSQNGHKNGSKSYFQQSLQNIERNLHSFTTGQENVKKIKEQSDKIPRESNNLFNDLSVSKKCYKTGCHSIQHMPRRRFVKVKDSDRIICINSYKKQLKDQHIQTKLVRNLKKSLGKFHSIFTEESKNHTDENQKNS